MNQKILLWVLMTCLLSGGCSRKEKQETTTRIITFGAYTVPKEVYEQIVFPNFKKYWKEKTGEAVEFKSSYVGSGSQSRAIAAGFEADVAALSLEWDVIRLENAGLVTTDWRNDFPYGGIVTRSLDVIGVRQGNPQNIRDWEDLKREGLEVMHPNPRTSGGAMWDVLSIYGSALRESEVLTGRKDFDYAAKRLRGIEKNVKTMGKSQRVNVTYFEQGLGDAVITYENELMLRQKQGKEYDIVYPRSTILIENPVAIVDAYVQRHGNRDVVEAFVNFLWTEEVQRGFAEFGFRVPHEKVAKEYAWKYPEVDLAFSVDFYGGWPSAVDTMFGPGGVWTTIMENLGKPEAGLKKGK
jgi:sulfate/thiosulfate-binding protein